MAINNLYTNDTNSTYPTHEPMETQPISPPTQQWGIYTIKEENSSDSDFEDETPYQVDLSQLHPSTIGYLERKLGNDRIDFKSTHFNRETPNNLRKVIAKFWGTEPEYQPIPVTKKAAIQECIDLFQYEIKRLQDDANIPLLSALGRREQDLEVQMITLNDGIKVYQQLLKNV